MAKHRSKIKDFQGRILKKKKNFTDPSNSNLRCLIKRINYRPYLYFWLCFLNVTLLPALAAESSKWSLFLQSDVTVKQQDNVWMNTWLSERMHRWIRAQSLLYIWTYSHQHRCSIWDLRGFHVGLSFRAIAQATKSKCGQRGNNVCVQCFLHSVTVLSCLHLLLLLIFLSQLAAAVLWCNVLERSCRSYNY